MNHRDEHYFKEFSDTSVHFYTVSVSLRKHLYLFKTTNGVFSYKKLDLGTKVLIENMIIPKSNLNLLDLGCGYGAIGMVLAYESPESIVYLTDINKRALWCTRQNTKINLPQEKDRVKVMFGSYFEPFVSKDIRFDAIYMNPPIRIGRKRFLKLFSDLPRFLNKNGMFQFVLRKKLGAEFVYNYLIETFSHQKIEIICKKSGYWVIKYVQV